MEIAETLVITYLVFGYLLGLLEVKDNTSYDYEYADFITNRATHIWLVMLFWPILVVYRLLRVTFALIGMVTLLPLTVWEAYQRKRIKKLRASSFGFPTSSRDWGN